ncbi:MAG: trans-aconitate methyltransferase [Frondihabitans sp.]|nr:trans-aconitate methyltransferase [Frondihabitans sp.]
MTTTRRNPDRSSLMTRWFAALPAGATFTMQAPANFDSPDHMLLRDQDRSERWRPLLADAVLDRGRGTRLRPVLSVLDADDTTAFEAEHAAALLAAYPPGPHGTVYPFVRRFLVATVPVR